MPSTQRPRPRRPAGTRARQDTAEVASKVVNGLRRVVRAIELYSREVLKSFGLTGPQLWALKTLARHGPMATTHLAQALAVQPSTLSVLVDRLERRGLVRRIRQREDRRFVEVALTPKGASLAAKAPEAAQGRLLHGLHALTPKELRAVHRSIETLVSMMEADNIKARFFFSDD